MKCPIEFLGFSDDLGGPISGYWIEKREENSDKWVPVNISPCQSNRFTVPSLLEDHTYEFRVVAENEAGKGIPSEASKLTKVGDKKLIFMLITKRRLTFRSKIPMQRHHRIF